MRWKQQCCWEKCGGWFSPYLLFSFCCVHYCTVDKALNNMPVLMWSLSLYKKSIYWSTFSRKTQYSVFSSDFAEDLSETDEKKWLNCSWTVRISQSQRMIVGILRHDWRRMSCCCLSTKRKERNIMRRKGKSFFLIHWKNFLVNDRVQIAKGFETGSANWRLLLEDLHLLAFRSLQRSLI